MLASQPDEATDRAKRVGWERHKNGILMQAAIHAHAPKYGCNQRLMGAVIHHLRDGPLRFATWTLGDQLRQHAVQPKMEV